MGHYDDAYEDEYHQQRQKRKQELAKRYVELKPHLSEINRLIGHFGGITLDVAFKNFEAALIYQLKEENVLILDPALLLDKLEKE
jgi:hypothetical protein